MQQLTKQDCCVSQHQIIKPDDRSVRVTAAPEPFSVRRVNRSFQAGLTVAEIVEQCVPDVRTRRFAKVWLAGHEILPENWAYVRPKPGTQLIVNVLPAGGGGGTNPLRLILQIAILAIAVAIPAAFPATFAALGGLAGPLFTAGVGIVGNLLLNALIPPTTPRMRQISDSRDSPTLSISGTRNQANPYGPVPRVFGKHRIYPPYAALPFTEIRGKDQYLVLLFAAGYGPLALSDHRIGETPLDQFEDVKIRVRPGYPDDEPLSIYTKDVKEEPLSILVDAASGWVVRRTEPETDRISIDLSWLQGLAAFDSSGDKQPRTVQLEVEFSLVGSGVWQAINGNIALGARTTSALKRPSPRTIKDNTQHRTIKYRISLDKLSGKIVIESSGFGVGFSSTSNIVIAEVTLSSNTAVAGTLSDKRSSTLVTNGWFAPTWNNSILKVSIGAGTLELPLFNVTANSTSVVRRNKSFDVDRGQYDVRIRRTNADTTSDKIFDKVTWTALRSIANRSPINMTGVCTVEMEIKATDQLNGVIDQYSVIASSILWNWDGSAWVEQETANAAACYLEVLTGSANHRPAAQDKVDWDAFEDWADSNRTKGREFNAVIDFRTTVLELQRDIGSVGRARFDMRDGLFSIVEDKKRTTPVQHFTPRNSFGFSANKAFPDRPHALKVRFISRDANWRQDERIVYADGFSEANATLFETIDAFGVTDPAQVFLTGRYMQAVAKLRPEVYEVSTDIEHILCRIGDLVLLTHDVMLVGLASGRIKSVTVDGSNNVTAMTVDEALPMEAGKAYGISVRTAANARVSGTVVTNAGEQTSISLSPSIPNVGGLPAVAAGDLFSFGETGKETIECIVKEIRAEGDLGARLVLIDHSPAIQDVDSEAIPAFDPHITLSPALNDNAPPKPAIQSIKSDETVLARQTDGAWESRIVMTLSHVANSRVKAESIEVQFRRSDAEDNWLRMPLFPGEASEVWAGPVEDKQTYDLRIRSIGSAGQTSNWTTVDDHVAIGKSTPPPDITTLLVETLRDSRRIVWTYPNPPRDLLGFVIKRQAGNNPEWDSAAPLHDQPITGMSFDLPMVDGTWTILIKAIDVGQNESLNAASSVINLGDVIVQNVVETTDLAAAGFPGTKTNGTVFGTDLKANDTGGLFWSGSDSALFWRDDTALFWTAIFLEMTYTASFSPETSLLPALLRIDTNVTASSWKLEYRPAGAQTPFWPGNDLAKFWQNDTALFWSPAPGLVPWPGEITPTHQLYDFRLTTAGGAVQGVISDFSIVLDVPDLLENLEDIILASGGTRLPITLPFRVIKNVGLTLQDDGGSARTIKIIDKNASLGPLVRAFDSAGSGTAALIDAAVQGY